MHPFFSAILLTIGAVLLWRSGWVTRQLAVRRSRRQTIAADFWMSWTPQNELVSGISSPAVPIMVDDGPTVETCDRCGPYVVAAHFAVRDKLVLSLCGHCGARHEIALVAGGWEVLHALIPIQVLPVG